jgi:imidazole glycerol-phosphate synthase subunit HisH
MTIAIVDYGLGNLRSVAGAVEKLGFEPVITSDEAALQSADKLILPGVGAFGDGMANLKQRGLVAVLNRLVLQESRPVLGICLGFQLIARRSDEFGQHDGLGWIDAEVRRLTPEDSSLRVPHVGWNDLIRTGASLLFDDIPEQSLFYYVHSHCVHMADPSVVGECDYGQRFVAVVQQDNIYGTQFHPEKSQQGGLTLLSNFLAKA